MRATGIVRRVDDLGRVVIPREIRRSMGIREGEPLEIFLDGRDTVCFRKYEANLDGDIDHLFDVILSCVEDDKIISKIKKLLGEVRELAKGEE